LTIPGGSCWPRHSLDPPDGALCPTATLPVGPHDLLGAEPFSRPFRNVTDQVDQVVRQLVVASTLKPLVRSASAPSGYCCWYWRVCGLEEFGQLFLGY
jgi:hypothetical protein